MIDLQSNDPRLTNLSSSALELALLFTFAGSYEGKHTSLPHAIQFSGQTYSPIDLVNLDLGDSESPPGRNLHVITIAETSGHVWRDRFYQGATGSTIVIDVVSRVASWSNPLTIYRGKLASVTHGIDAEQSIVSLSYASLLSQVDVSHAVHISDREQRLRSSSDTCFAQLSSANKKVIR